MCVPRRLIPVILAIVGKLWMPRPRMMLCLLEAVLLQRDTDFELHPLSHGPGDAVVSHQTTRRVVVVRSASLGCHD